MGGDCVTVVVGRWVDGEEVETALVLVLVEDVTEREVVDVDV